MSRDPVPHPADRGAVEPGKRDRELGPEFLLELGQHGPSRDHQDPVGPPTEGQFRSDQARLQGLPEASVVRDQEPNPVLRQRPLHREVLEGQIVNCSPAERQGAARRRRCRSERGREVHLRVDQTGGGIRDEPDRCGGQGRAHPSRGPRRTGPLCREPDRSGPDNRPPGTRASELRLLAPSRWRSGERLRRSEDTPSQLQPENLVFRGFKKGEIGLPAKYARKIKRRSKDKDDTPPLSGKE